MLRANEERIRCEGEVKLAEEQLSSVSGTVQELVRERETLEKRIETILQNAAEAKEKLETVGACLHEKEQRLEKLTGDREALAAAREALSERRVDAVEFLAELLRHTRGQIGDHAV